MTFYWNFTNYLCTYKDKHLSVTPDKIFWGPHHRIFSCFGISWIDLYLTFSHNFSPSLRIWMFFFLGCQIRLAIFTFIFLEFFGKIISSRLQLTLSFYVIYVIFLCYTIIFMLFSRPSNSLIMTGSHN